MSISVMTWRLQPQVQEQSNTSHFRSLIQWPHGLQPTRLLCLWYFPGKDTGVGCHFLLQGIFPSQGLNLVSFIASRFFTNWATREAQYIRISIVLKITLDGEFYYDDNFWKVHIGVYFFWFHFPAKKKMNSNKTLCIEHHCNPAATNIVSFF